MNSAAITGAVVSKPYTRIHAFVLTTTFDVRVDFARRRYSFRVRAMNELAKSADGLRVGDHVAITDYLHLEPVHLADDIAWHFEIVAYEIDHDPVDNNRGDDAVSCGGFEIEEEP